LIPFKDRFSIRKKIEYFFFKTFVNRFTKQHDKKPGIRFAKITPAAKRRIFLWLKFTIFKRFLSKCTPDVPFGKLQAGFLAP
jgi:hypothetical protein